MAKLLKLQNLEMVEKATKNRFQVLLDDDRKIQVTPDPEPRIYVPGGDISLIDLLFYYPRRPIGGAGALNLVHRFGAKQFRVP